MATLAYSVAWFASSAAAQSAEKLVRVEVELGGVHQYVHEGAISKLAIGDETCAEIKPIPPNKLVITGRKPCRTQVNIWSNNRITPVDIVVTFPHRTILNALERSLKNSKNLDVVPAGFSLILRGEVASQADVKQAEAIAKAIAQSALKDGKVEVINMLTITNNQQVQLEVSFAEVSRSSLKEIGFNFWGRGNDIASGILAPGNRLATGFAPALNGQGQLEALNAIDVTRSPLVAAPLQNSFGLLFSAALGEFPFAAALSVLARRGYARTLAEPTLVTLSGHSASFLAGGEFPIPVAQQLGQLTVDYKKFGVQLSFSPEVDGNMIQMQMSMTVSDIDTSTGVRLSSTTVPGLTSRYSESVVRLKDGQSFAIAGLLSDTTRSTIDKVPGLGDIPILGTLFKSTSYQREETELLVVVQAHLVRPVEERPKLPGEELTADPHDLALFLWNSIETVPGEIARDAYRPEKQSSETKPTGKPAGNPKAQKERRKEPKKESKTPKKKKNASDINPRRERVASNENQPIGPLGFHR